MKTDMKIEETANKIRQYKAVETKQMYIHTQFTTKSIAMI